MPRILLIEDEPSLRRALCLALERSGHEVIEAGDGREAMAAFQAQPVDLVVTDLIMPEMEGVETIRALRKLSPVLPIIAITGGGRGAPASYLTLAQRFGASKMIAKPFEPDILCKAVASLLGADGAAPAG